MKNMNFYSIACLLGATALASAAPAVAQPLNLCTGTDGQPYFQVGKMIASQARDYGVAVNVIETKGTWDNIERSTGSTPDSAAYDSGAACHAFIGQPDGMVILKRKSPADAAKVVVIGTAHAEYLHVLCGKDSGVDELTDLEGDAEKSVALGLPGSGAHLIWDNFKFEDDDYAAVQEKNLSGIEAVAAVSSGQVTCMLVPAALGNQTVAVDADESFGDSLVLATADDKDFNDALAADGKTPLYEWGSIPSGTYNKNLQSSWMSSVDTVRWRATVYLNTERFSDAKAKANFIRAVAAARKEAISTYGE